MSNNKSFDHIESKKPKKLSKLALLSCSEPLNIKIKDQISKFQNKMHSHKRASPAEITIKIDENATQLSEEEDRWKIEKLEKGSSWKKRFQMMYRAKMLKLDKKVRTDGLEISNGFCR